MKQLRKPIIIFLLACSFVFYGCTNWLSIDPVDQVLEGRQFSTELRINSVLNGIYRSMAQNSLYGELLTQTFIEYLARYYHFWNDGLIPTGIWSEVARFNYASQPVRSMSQTIWNNAYSTILQINMFIENVSQSDVVRESRRNVLLGEAYALRAFLHFDLFRLFGPIYQLDPQEPEPSIPFSNSTQAINRTPETATNLLNLVLRDLETAERLLENDPIRTRGVNDNFYQVTLNHGLTPETRFAEYFRNRRMNYYAVRALRARVLLHARRFQEAATLAAEVLEEATRAREGGGRAFSWEENLHQVRQMNNFMFYNEVLFGLTNLNQHANWTRFFEGGQAGLVHVVLESHLKNNIFGDLPQGLTIESMVIADVRAGQWRQSNIPFGTSTGTGFGLTFVSTKFRQPVITDWSDPNARYMVNFQPLIRLSELLYIQAEAAIRTGGTALAVEKINYVLIRRGIPSERLLPATATLPEVEAALEREFYKEFVGEGQVFFFLKRNAKTSIFSGFGTGRVTIATDDNGLRNVYVVPLPDSEVIVG